MHSAACNYWLLPATLFFDALAPAWKSVAEILPLVPAAQSVRRRRKIIRSKRVHRCLTLFFR